MFKLSVNIYVSTTEIETHQDANTSVKWDLKDILVFLQNFIKQW